MKKILLFTVLIALGFVGGSIMPQVWAESNDSKTEQSCTCGCGPTEVKVMMVPTGSESEMLLTAGLIEAISNDSDNSLSREELVTIINKVQKEYTETTEKTTVEGASIKLPENESNTTVSSYEEMITRFLAGSGSTTTESASKTQYETDTFTTQSRSASSLSIIQKDEEPSESTQNKKIKNNNGLGNGSESADRTISDVKGDDPSNTGKGQKSSKTLANGTSSTKEVKSSNSDKGKTKSRKSKEKKEKVKNNNGLGNGSEPADGTSSDIKGIDPSNPGNGGSKSNVGK